MKKLGIFLPILAGFAASPAYAQDFGIAPRVEIRAGYDEVRGGIRVENSAFSSDFGVGDAMIGAEAGVDARIFPTVLVGAYVGIEVSDAGGCKERPFFTFNRSREDSVCVEAGHNVFAGLRAGIPVGDEGLLYAKGGYSRGRFEGSYTNTPAATMANPNPAPQQLFSGRDTVSGYHFGGGFELNFTPSIYVKAEYVQHRYDDAFTDLLTGTDRFDPKRHQLVAGIGFRFGGNR